MVRCLPLRSEENGFSNSPEIMARERHGVTGWCGVPYRFRARISKSAAGTLRVIAGNGLGMQDAFAEPEIESGHLVWISELALTNFAYCIALPTKGNISAAAEIFQDWIRAQDF